MPRLLGRRRMGELLALAPLSLSLPFAGCRARRPLALYNWGEYLAPTVAERFLARERERDDGATELLQDYYLSEAEMMAKLAAGGAHDVVFPIDYLLPRMQRLGLLRALDLAALPGVANLDPAMGPWSASRERGGACYAIPYLWGTTGIGYDSERISPAPTSWRALFDPRWAGRISVIDAKGDVFDQALLAAGMDINSTDKPAIRARVMPMLEAQRGLLRAYDANPARALVAGDTWIAQIDSGDLMKAQKRRPSLRYLIPEEGAVLWIDYLAIPSAATAPASALRFLEFLLDPEIAAENANELCFATPNREALARGLIARADDPSLYPPRVGGPPLHVSENWFGNTEAVVDELWLRLRGG